MMEITSITKNIFDITRKVDFYLSNLGWKTIESWGCAVVEFSSAVSQLEFSQDMTVYTQVKAQRAQPNLFSKPNEEMKHAIASAKNMS